MEISYEQLKEFYKQAHADGYKNRLVCGGLGKCEDPSDSRVALALVKAMKEKEH